MFKIGCLVEGVLNLDKSYAMGHCRQPGNHLDGLYLINIHYNFDPPQGGGDGRHPHNFWLKKQISTKIQKNFHASMGQNA